MSEGPDSGLAPPHIVVSRNPSDLTPHGSATLTTTPHAQAVDVFIPRGVFQKIALGLTVVVLSVPVALWLTAKAVPVGLWLAAKATVQWLFSLDDNSKDELLTTVSCIIRFSSTAGIVTCVVLAFQYHDFLYYEVLAPPIDIQVFYKNRIPVAPQFSFELTAFLIWSAICTVIHWLSVVVYHIIRASRTIPPSKARPDSLYGDPRFGTAQEAIAALKGHDPSGDLTFD